MAVERDKQSKGPDARGPSGLIPRSSRARADRQTDEGPAEHPPPRGAFSYPEDGRDAREGQGHVAL